MNSLLDHIITEFKSHENPVVAKGMQTYMRDQFAYLGITSPNRKALSKPIINEVAKEPKSVVYPLIRALWTRPEREFHYLALDIYLKVAKKMMDEADIEILETLICNHSWWDTVDFISPKLMRMYFDKFPESRNKVVDRWVESANRWLQRSALLFQLKQKEEVDLHYMFITIQRLSGGKEFFINKAIGWLLREHSKRIPEEIRFFIEEHEEQLSGLSRREGLKYC